jgi:hypothetical protein
MELQTQNDRLCILGVDAHWPLVDYQRCDVRWLQPRLVSFVYVPEIQVTVRFAAMRHDDAAHCDAPFDLCRAQNRQS